MGAFLGGRNIFSEDSLTNLSQIFYFYGIYGSLIIAYIWYLAIAVINIINKTRFVQSGLCIISTALFLAVFVVPSIFRLNVNPEDWYIFWFVIFPIYPVYHAIEALKNSKEAGS